MDPMSSMWAWLAYDLRRYRQSRGETLAAAGSAMGVSPQTFSNYEATFRRPDLKGVKALDKAWNTLGHFTRIFTYAQTAHVPDWFREHLEYEARARILRIWEPLVVPGLLQNEEYARTVFKVEGANDERANDVEADVRVRMARQELLSRKSPPRVHVLLDEGVLDRPVGGPKIMRAQLAHLLEVSQLPNVNLRVHPRSDGYHRGLAGPFKIMTCDPEGDVAYTEAAEGGRLVLDSAGVRRFAARFDDIGAEALGRTATRELIKRVMEVMI